MYEYIIISFYTTFSKVSQKSDKRILSCILNNIVCSKLPYSLCSTVLTLLDLNSHGQRHKIILKTVIITMLRSFVEFTVANDLNILYKVSETVHYASNFEIFELQKTCPRYVEGPSIGFPPFLDWVWEPCYVTKLSISKVHIARRTDDYYWLKLNKIYFD